MKTAKHEYSSFNIVAKAALGILFAFAISIIDSPRAFAQEATSAGSTIGGQSTSISLLEVERINVFIKFLASNNAQERILAIKVLESFALRKQFPPELVQVLVQLYDTDKDSVVVRSAASVLLIVADFDSSLYKAMTPRVTILIQNEGQRKVANEIARSLQIEYVTDIRREACVVYTSAGVVDQTTYLVTSSVDDIFEAQKIMKNLETYEFALGHLNGVEYYYLQTRRPRHFELCLAPNLTALHRKR